MQRSQKYSSPSDSSASPSPPGGHSPPQHAANRPELVRLIVSYYTVTRVNPQIQKAELKPLFTTTPLSLSDREKNLSPTPRKRKKQEPTTPAFTFPPQQNRIPSGRADPPMQTPVSHQRQPTSTSTTTEFHEWTPDEVDDQLSSGITALPLPIPSKRPRSQNGSDESSQSPSYPPYLRYTDYHEPPSAGGSSALPATPYASSPHPHYGLDTDHHFNTSSMPQYYDPTGADYRRVTPDAYGMSRDPGYHPPQGSSWQYSNGYHDSF